MPREQLVRVVVDDDPGVLTGDPQAYPKVEEGVGDQMTPGGFYLDATGEPVDAFGVRLADKGRSDESDDAARQVVALQQQIQDGNQENARLQQELQAAQAELTRAREEANRASAAHAESQQELARTKAAADKLAAAQRQQQKPEVATAQGDAARQDVKDGEVKPQGS